MKVNISNHGLSKEQLNILRNILLPFSKQIERVGLFGSRATGFFVLILILI
ncbi:MAG: hypothetical protein LBH99_05185 [Rickettsia sp.]|nr:hypothetical protein [Rickettsia sp.]